MMMNLRCLFSNCLYSNQIKLCLCIGKLYDFHLSLIAVLKIPPHNRWLPQILWFSILVTLRVATHWSVVRPVGVSRSCVLLCCLYLAGTDSLTDTLPNSRQCDIIWCLTDVLFGKCANAKCACVLWCTGSCVWVWAACSRLKQSLCCSSSLDLKCSALRCWYYFHCYVTEYDKLFTWDNTVAKLHSTIP